MGFLDKLKSGLAKTKKAMEATLGNVFSMSEIDDDFYDELEEGLILADLGAGLAAVAYEIGLYLVGLFMGLTRWYRLPRFLLTGALTVAAMIPLYYFIYRIGQIGGCTWKE